MGTAPLTYDVVGVFCDRPFAGNPLAVVHGAADLTTAQLQALAREFNLSETAFPVPGADRVSYDVRIFTPGDEIPFAGHPTVGTAWLLRSRGLLAVDEVVQHCGVGPVDVQVSDGGAELSARPRWVGEPVLATSLAAGVGLTADDLVGGSRVASCGLAWTFLRVRADAVARCRPGRLDVPAVGGDPMGGLCVYAVLDGSAGTADSGALTVHARVFCPDHGIVEDPATGSAAAALGPVLAAEGLATDGTTAYAIAQGAEVGRPSTLRCRVHVAGGAATRVWVAGGVRRVATGTIDVPPV